LEFEISQIISGENPELMNNTLPMNSVRWVKSTKSLNAGVKCLGSKKKSYALRKKFSKSYRELSWFLYNAAIKYKNLCRLNSMP
jgi:hypothetical protein